VAYPPHLEETRHPEPADHHPGLASVFGNHIQEHGTLKGTQGALRHASITTTVNIYVQVIEQNVMRAVNSHATAVLNGWTPSVERLGVKGRKIRSLPADATIAQGPIAI
jgi:hypothetical protein